MKFRRKQLVMAAMVLALGAAVYLTWTFQDKAPATVGVNAGVEEESSQLGVAQLVNNAYMETHTGDGATGKDAEDAAVGRQKTLSEARVSRQKSRDEAIALIDQVLEDAEADSQAKQDAVAQASAIAQNIMKETNVENLLSAKGYTDSVAYITESDCNIVVSGDIEAADALIIQEIVVSQTALTADKIQIVNAK